MKNKHLRKESNRYYSGKDNFANSTLSNNGHRSKRSTLMNQDVSLKEAVFYDNYDTS